MRRIERSVPSTRAAYTHATITNASTTADEAQALIEQERNRIARDLHDSVVQQIVAALQRLEMAQRLLEQQRYQDAQHEIQQSSAILNESIQELRNCIAALLPTRLQQHSFAEALTTLLREYAHNHPQIELKHVLSALNDVPTYLEIPIYWLLQEALNNIHKHAQATRVTIHLTCDTTILTLTIHDNGRGLPEQQQSIDSMNNSRQKGDKTTAQGLHLGLHTMRTRVEEQGGTWQIQSQKGSGTTLQARFRLQPSHTSDNTSRKKTH